MNCIAVDIGAGSGRIIRGALDEDGIKLKEVHRFRNGMKKFDGHLRWDMGRLFNEVCKGLRKASKGGEPPSSIGIDAWGVDFVLLDSKSRPLGPPIAYRDPRTDGMMEHFLERMDARTIYRRTGTQFLHINTLYQLFAMAQSEPRLLRKARHILMVPDYLNFLLTGKKCMEFTNATTTQMLDIEKKDWVRDILKKVPLDPALLSRPVEPGTIIGPLTSKIQRRTGLGPINVIAPATHDTGSAVASVPATGTDWAFISSGTWSLMGKEIGHPICTKGAMDHNFTNEGGVAGTYRFLKNNMGLWLVSELQKDLLGKRSFAELESMARRARPFSSLIDPNDKRFFNPRSMKKALDVYLRSTDQPVPRTPGTYIRCALESLALSYREVLAELRATHPGNIARVHIIGGGCQNRLLDQMTADALGLPVLAGPVEGTAVGNILVQAIALGEIKDLEEGRRLVKGSFNIQKYTPRDTDAWDAAWTRFEHIREGLR